MYLSDIVDYLVIFKEEEGGILGRSILKYNKPILIKFNNKIKFRFNIPLTNPNIFLKTSPALQIKYLDIEHKNLDKNLNYLICVILEFFSNVVYKP